MSLLKGISIAKIQQFQANVIVIKNIERKKLANKKTEKTKKKNQIKVVVEKDNIREIESFFLVNYFQNYSCRPKTDLNFSPDFLLFYKKLLKKTTVFSAF